MALPITSHNKYVCTLLNFLRNEDSLKHRGLISVGQRYSINQRIPIVENTVLSPPLLNIMVSVSVWEGGWGWESGGGSLSRDGERSASIMHMHLKGKE